MPDEKTREELKQQEKEYDEAQRVVQILNKLEDTLYRLDLDSLELYTDVTNLRELEKLLEGVNLNLVEEISWNEIYDLAGPEKLWEVEVASHSKEGKFYKVRYEVPDDKEKPDLTCTCPDFIFNNSNGKYCKHIEEVVIGTSGMTYSDPVVPEDANIIGKFQPTE